MSRNNGYCHIVGSTDVGCVRKANEDSLGWSETKNGLVAVVCDGMGGHVGGATASRMAVDTILNVLDTEYYSDPRIAIGSAIDLANKAILKKTDETPELKGMGSTCVLLIVRDGLVYVGSVGDSRIYLVRNRIIRQLTKDHSYVQMLIDMGQLRPEEAEKHPRRNEITNALGIAEMKPATILQEAITPEAGDCFLLCSDGLTGMVADKEIVKVVSKQTELSAQERIDLLIHKAKVAGGLDNITVQIVEFSVAPAVEKSRKKLFITALSMLVFIIAIGVAFFCFSDKENTSIANISEEINLELTSFEYNNEVLSLTKEQEVYNLYHKNKLLFTFDKEVVKDSIENLQPYFQCVNMVDGFKLITTGLLPQEEVKIRFKNEFKVLTITIALRREKLPNNDSSADDPVNEDELVLSPRIASSLLEPKVSIGKKKQVENATEEIVIGSVDFQKELTFLFIDFSSGKDVKIRNGSGEVLQTMEYVEMESFVLCSNQKQVEVKQNKKRVELRFVTDSFTGNNLCFQIGQNRYSMKVTQPISAVSIPESSYHLKEKALILNEIDAQKDSYKILEKEKSKETDEVEAKVEVKEVEENGTETEILVENNLDNLKS